MPIPANKTEPITREQTPLQSLFQSDIADRVLLSVHLLGKPTSAQLFRLHSDQVSTERQMRSLMASHCKKDGKLVVLKPLDIENTSRKLPHVFLDTIQSRRHLQKTFGVPYRRPSKLPSRDWRFLKHDVDLVDELVTFELTARAHNIPFGYESHYDTDGAPVYPRVTITDGALTAHIKPAPDKTIIVGDYHVIREKDNGTETVDLGNIIRDATVTRKHLVYDQLERMGTLDQLGWKKRIYTYTIDTPRHTKISSRKRIKRCLETIPAPVNPHRIFFVDRQTFIETGDDISQLQWVRGDGQVLKLPCWR